MKDIHTNREIMQRENLSIDQPFFFLMSCMLPFDCIDQQPEHSYSLAQRLHAQRDQLTYHFAFFLWVHWCACYYVAFHDVSVAAVTWLSFLTLLSFLVSMAERCVTWVSRCFLSCYSLECAELVWVWKNVHNEDCYCFSGALVLRFRSHAVWPRHPCLLSALPGIQEPGPGGWRSQHLYILLLLPVCSVSVQRVITDRLWQCDTKAKWEQKPSETWKAKWHQERKQSNTYVTPRKCKARSEPSGV